MTKKIKDICVKTGSYESGGKTRNRYQNVGHVLQLNDGGEIFCLNRTFSPAGCPNPDNRDTVILSLFDVKDNADIDNPKAETAAVDVLETDTIPF